MAKIAFFKLLSPIPVIKTLSLIGWIQFHKELGDNFFVSKKKKFI